MYFCFLSWNEIEVSLVTPFDKWSWERFLICKLNTSFKARVIVSPIFFWSGTITSESFNVIPYMEVAILRKVQLSFANPKWLFEAFESCVKRRNFSSCGNTWRQPEGDSFSVKAVHMCCMCCKTWCSLQKLINAISFIISLKHCTSK